MVERTLPPIFPVLRHCFLRWMGGAAKTERKSLMRNPPQ